MIITIDGPSGVGKGTLGRALAAHYGYAYLDTGLLFRAVAHACVHEGCDLAHEGQVLKMAHALDLSALPDETVLRREEVGEAASKIGVFPGVREAINHHIRRFAATHPRGVVVDGRDMGTVLFPNAPRKIYLTASAEERARRRIKDLTERGMTFDAPQILADIKARDHRDATRTVAPLRPADDALVIDTSDLSAQDVLTKVMGFII